VTEGLEADSKAVTRIETGDFLETVGITKDDEAGLSRVQCKVAKDEKEGWVTIKGSSGTAFIEIILPFTTYGKEMDKALATAHENMQKVGVFLNAKLKEGGLVATGPLAEARKEITTKRAEITKAQSALEQLKKKVQGAKSKYFVTEKAELNAHIIARDMKEAEVITGCAKPLVQAAEVAFKEVESKTEELTSLDNEGVLAFPKPATLMEELEKLAAAAQEKLTDARKSVKEQSDVANAVTPATRGTVEAKKQIKEMQLKLDPMTRNAAKAFNNVRAKCKLIVDKVYMEASRELRDIMRKGGITGEKFYEQLANGQDKIPEDKFCKKLTSLEGLNIQPEHAKLLSRSIEIGGISRRQFLGYIQLYYAVVKAVALTDIQDVNSCKTVRKAELDEVLEVLEGPVTDPDQGLVRVRVKSMMDQQEGWITVKGNQGTPFLQEVEKPFFTVKKELPLGTELSGNENVRTLTVDEIVELVEGPRKVTYTDLRRAKVKAVKDGAVGWMTVRDRFEVVYAETNAKMYTIKQSVALTDGPNISECKVLRKLTEGELFHTEGEPVEDGGVWRVGGVAKKDDLKGWLTSKGNAGTVYAEVANKSLTVTKEVELHKVFKSVDVNPEVVRMLEAGEELQVTEGPKDEKIPTDTRVKVRCLSDGSVGWMSRKTGFVKAWTPNYKVLEKVPMHGSRAIEGATEVRELQKGDVVELLEGPVADGKALRIKCCTQTERVVGWVTLTDGEGKRFLDC